MEKNIVYYSKVNTNELESIVGKLDVHYFNTRLDRDSGIKFFEHEIWVKKNQHSFVCFEVLGKILDDKYEVVNIKSTSIDYSTREVLKNVDLDIVDNLKNSINNGLIYYKEKAGSNNESL